jgi:hypothetical protein
MNDPVLHQTVSTLIQASLSPVFLLTAIAATLTVIDTRQNRIVDRARALEQQIIAQSASTESLEAEIEFYLKRARQIGRAAAACILSALSVALAVVALFIDAQIATALTPLVEGTFTLAVLFYVVALMIYLRDIFRVTHGLTFTHQRVSVALAERRRPGP